MATFRYPLGTRVEIEGWDNQSRSVRFVPGTVSRLTGPYDDGTRDVTVALDQGGVKVARVGRRGGGTGIRLLEDAPTADDYAAAARAAAEAARGFNRALLRAREARS